MVTICPQTADGIEFVRKYYNDPEREKTEQDQKMFMSIKDDIVYRLFVARRWISFIHM